MVSDGSSKLVRLFNKTSSKKFEFPYVSVLLSFASFLLYSMQLSQREYFFRDGMQDNLHERSSKENLLLNVVVIMDGQIIIKSKTLCRSTFCERDMQSCQT